MLKKQTKSAVPKQLQDNVKGGLHSLFMMLMGALIALMVVLFLYFSPLFASKDTAKTDDQHDDDSALAVQELMPQYQFYDVLPSQQTISFDENMPTPIIAEAKTDVVVQADAKNDALKIEGSNNASSTKADDAPKISMPSLDAPLYAEDTSNQNKDEAPVINIARTNPDSTYILQIKSFEDANLAEKARAQATMLGVDAKVVPSTHNGQSLYKVVSNTMHSKDEAAAAHDRLRRGGVDSLIVEQKY